MRLVLLTVLGFLSLACAPSPATPQDAAGAPRSVATLALPTSQTGADASVPVQASFTLSGVESADELPPGVVHIMVDTEAGPRPLGVVNLYSPSGGSLERSVILDLAAALTPEQLAAAAEAGSVNLSFEVDTPAGAPPITLEAVEARIAE